MKIKHILIVARWPLGGIRTYMRYMLSRFPPSFKLTLIAASTVEDLAVINDAKEYGAKLLLVNATKTRTFVYAISRELKRNKYDAILSQGFVSAVSVFIANIFFKVPHILTIHGIVEPQYLNGVFGFLKRNVLEKIVKNVTVLYAVSNDILDHVYEQFPKLRKNGPKTIVISNGIEPCEFDQLPSVPLNLRQIIGIDNSTFLIGFFGRCVPQKGFDLLCEAVSIVIKQKNRSLTVAVVGSDGYSREYQNQLKNTELGKYIHFLPFQPQVHHLYPQVDAIVIPSRWEACPLLPMEVLCMGTPLIASDCIGLRETVAGTPAKIFSSENVSDLAELIHSVMMDTDPEAFQRYIPIARERYDVSKSAAELVIFIEKMLEQK